MKQPTTLFEQFAENLYRESPRGAYALESMKYGIMARTGLDETDALEVACRIVLTGKESAPRTYTHTSSRKRAKNLPTVTGWKY